MLAFPVGNRSCLFHLPHQYTVSVFFTWLRWYTRPLSPTVKQQCNNQNNNNAEITPFIPVLAGWNLCDKPHSTRDETRDLQIAPPRMLMLPFFSILLAVHTQDTFLLVFNFEVGHFARHFLLLSFLFLPSFLPSFWCCYERNSFHTALLSDFISLVHPAHHLFFIQPGMVARFT